MIRQTKKTERSSHDIAAKGESMQKIESMEHSELSLDTRIGFASLDTSRLKKAYYLFSLIRFPQLSITGGKILSKMLKLGFPVRKIIEKTMFEHFCGGENLEQASRRALQLKKNNVATVFDYAAEGISCQESFLENQGQILASIELAAGKKELFPFCVFKVTGVADFNILKKISLKQPLDPKEETNWQFSSRLIEELMQKAHDLGVPLMVDAEETWIAPAIDDLVEKSMLKWNSSQAIILQTMQMYRNDRLQDLKKLILEAKEKKFILGVKLVRGAYLEKENNRALKKGYPTPMQPDKKTTDQDYDLALKMCLENIEHVCLFVGTHNEKSINFARKIMSEQNIAQNHPHVYFSQLLGMSDVVSFNLAHHGYNVCKYVPFGPIEKAIPYLLRRAEENSSVSGQSARELELMALELKRRKHK